MDNFQPQPAVGDEIAQPTPQAPPQAMPVASPAVQSEPLDYVSNPFLVGLRSVIAGLKNNPVAIMLTPLVVIAGILLVVILAVVLAATESTAGSAIMVLLIPAAYLSILPLILGMYYTIAVHSANDQKISTKEAFDRSLKRTLPMLGLIIVCALATVLGLILLIIPGIIFFVRSSLAPTAMYFENLGVFAAIKRSFALTKGHFIETLGASLAGGFLGSNGLIAPYFGISQMVGRYHDYKALQESGAAKPKIHWLNYIPIVVLVIFGALYGVIATAFLNTQQRAKDSSQQSQQLQQNNNSYDYRYDSDWGTD